MVAVEGVVRSRPSNSVNEKMKTGFIEVAAERVQVLNAVRSKLPFLVTAADDAKDLSKEEIRLRFPPITTFYLIFFWRELSKSSLVTFSCCHCFCIGCHRMGAPALCFNCKCESVYVRNHA